MEWLLTLLAHQPFAVLFLVVAAGYALGRVQIKRIGLGSTASTLIVGIVLSLAAASYDIAFSISDFASTIFFNLFMFSVGMKVGPQFLVGLRRDAKNFVIIGLFIPLVSVALMFAVRALFTLEPGMLAGIFAGSNTATPGLGAAQSAISEGVAKLPPGVEVDTAIANLSTAFAFTYCASVVLFAVLIKLPDLLGRDSAKAARELETSLGADHAAPLPGAPDEFFRAPLRVAHVVRAYELVAPNAIGHTLGELRERFPLISVERVVRDGKTLEPRDDIELREHDIVTLHGDLARLVPASARLGPEVTSPLALDVGTQTVDVVIDNTAVTGRTLLDLAKGAGYGLYLNAMFRAGDEIPYGADTVVHKGDVLRVTGSTGRIAALEQHAGKVIHPSLSTDIVTLALGAAIGALLGAITIHIGGIALQVGSAVGLLIAGMALSIARTRNPSFGGPYPEPARQLIEDLGLNVFVAVLGLDAGVGVVAAVQQGALGPILVSCLIVGFIPPILAWLLGAYVLKMNDALLMGAVAGGRCSSPGMRAAQETTRSAIPTLSYPATFAISNIVCTLLAYLIAVVD
jgi:putative transport protein